MVKNIIILTLLGIIMFDVSSKEFFDYMQKGLDKTQEIERVSHFVVVLGIVA